MCLERSNRSIKRKFIYNMFIALFILLVGIIGGIVLCSKLKNFNSNEKENREKIEGEDWENYINFKNEEKMDNDIEAESNIQGEEGLREILLNIHKDYISKQWFGEEKYGIPNNYYENRISYGAGDLENVIFYMDNKEKIYFIPTSMVNKKINLHGKEIDVNECEVDGKLNLYLYRYEIYDPEPQRVIYPEPDKHISILSCEVQDFVSKLNYLGTISLNFPKSVPEGARMLYEKEYTDAVVKLIHSFLFDYKEYGNYLIYIGDYSYNELVYEKEKYDYNISITVAIVGEETSYWWEFHAKEGLGENGEVILESNGGDSYSGPGDYDQQNGAYASDIDSIIHANRLVIPLLVTENDEVEAIEIRRDERNINLDHYYLK